MLFSESIHGIPVINGGVGFNYDGKTKRITDAFGQLHPRSRVATQAEAVRDSRPSRIAGGEVVEPTYLGYLLPCCGPRLPKLVWAVSVWVNEHYMIYVDAISGEVVDRVRMSKN